MKAMIPWRNQNLVRPTNAWTMMDRVFEDLWRDERLPRVFTNPIRGFSPHMDITETETAYVVNAELPGLTLADVDLTLKDGHLTITGEKKRDEETDGIRYNERSYGKFERVLNLRDNVRQDDIEARFTNGILTVTLPKRDPDEGVRKIEVKSE